MLSRSARLLSSVGVRRLATASQVFPANGPAPKIVYEATGVASGDGREGKTKSGALDLVTNKPKAMGGSPTPGSVNPEELFAAGYAACFLGAVKFVAGKAGITLDPTTTLTSKVGLGGIPGGFNIEVQLTLKSIGGDLAALQKVVADAHTVCPYSNATKGNVQVTLTVEV